MSEVATTKKFLRKAWGPWQLVQIHWVWGDFDVILTILVFLVFRCETQRVSPDFCSLELKLKTTALGWEL